MDLDPLLRLRRLAQALPPGWAYSLNDPADAPATRTYDWSRIERDTGVQALPPDYKRIAEAFGEWVIAGIFLIGPDNFAEMHELHGGRLRRWWSRYPEGSRPVHPEPGGLLLCASTEGRDILWWDTSHADPVNWTITWDVEFHKYTFEGTLTDLLIAELTGRVRPKLTSFTVDE